jgi:hypothetical protein
MIESNISLLLLFRNNSMSSSISSIPAPQADKHKLRFIFLEKSSTIDTYESFGKEGFGDQLSQGYVNNSTEHAKRPYEQEKRFLSAVDLTKGPILVSVQSIIRTMAVDWDSPKRERKEMMYYNTEWEAKDWLGNTIRCSHEAEGKFTEQTKQIQTRLNPQTGEHTQEYHMGVPRDAYKIPWDKKKANELLTSEKIFGEDSLNITNLSEVQYTVKFPSGNPGRTGFGMQDFLDLKYEKLQELSKTVKSPYLADLERIVNPYK